MHSSTAKTISVTGYPWPLLAVLSASVLVSYVVVIWELARIWITSPEYSFGLVIPVLIGYILFCKRHSLTRGFLRGSWWAIGLLLIGQSLLLVAQLADIEAVKRYAMLISLTAAVIAVGGILLLKRFSIVFLLLLFALPLPYLLNAIITSNMQLISSDLGVWMLRLMGFAVHQDGNVISLGSFTMLVAEACSGLRYLYPLMAIALIIAYFFIGPWWSRVLIFLAAIPITIVMNSLRIAMTGVLIKHFGVQAAEGFLHDFEGWLVFLTAFVWLLISVWVLSWFLNRLTNHSHPFHQRFNLALEEEATQSPSGLITPTALIPSFVILALLTAISAHAIVFIKDTQVPARKSFKDFPFTLEGREIYPQLLSRQVLDVLKADDYFSADYKKANSNDVNLYVAYYQHQKEGSALHSPRVCLPGGGWNIKNIEVTSLAKFGSSGKANRVIIEQGQRQLLVYYWIQQQGKNYANEFQARLMLLMESALRGRTDGAIIRVISPVVAGDVPQAEQHIANFIRALTPVLPHYLPE